MSSKTPAFTNEQIDFMREDLESNMGYSKMIIFVQNKFKEEGRDFEEEFKALKAKQEND